MKLDQSKPILYLITRGVTSEAPNGFEELSTQISAAVSAGIDLIQIREKNLQARELFELTEQAVALTSGTSTRVLVNDRADIAAGAGAAGVHLSTRSLDPATTRRTFGEKFLIGVSAHSLREASEARDGGADFAVLGPVFETSSKLQYGPPLGLAALGDAARQLAPFPLFALGGVSIRNARECLHAGARGIAGISMFANPDDLKRLSERVKSVAQSDLWAKMK